VICCRSSLKNSRSELHVNIEQYRSFAKKSGGQEGALGMRSPRLPFIGHYSVACLAEDLSDSVSRRMIAETGNTEDLLRGLECMKS
jgi:hypothetical protein